ncbi:MAG TPA: sigma-70 family RNA polymerase sigma factor [Candidatus Saccharicenans sp.]|nr:sigma-70 family RNA polymerase sigma factor [Candidatus Saccharicenans sp.]HNT01579.1 sigma-70 family RNA polymerase sigma factor [Candidatus Saccharicenans sp.]HPB59101.1 sigma-70 family RNA polymerase sigma factor [Candidatus Saccharicenans sp.]HQO75221.1 sigma-70 family RNA polymerase sigma factor [Candidatus Saccharicenans sp.]HUM78411.1 sigma-70 family RNA polymerase sigma factor [Candidatus Saccharicenans sp.]
MKRAEDNQPMEENEVVKLAQQGDKEAFSVLVRNYQNKVFGLAINIVRNHETADDLAQEIFIKAYQSLPRFRFQSEFSTWLYQIAINHIRDHLRKHKKEKNDLRLDEIPEISGEEKEASEQLANRQEEEYRKRLLREKLEEMPEKYRLILSLRDIQGLSYEEISKMLKLSAGTVDSRLHRARRLLRKKLAQALGQEGGKR